VKRPASPYARFLQERVSSGDMNGMAVGEIGKLVAKEYKELGGAEKKVRCSLSFLCLIYNTLQQKLTRWFIAPG
jgi:hypothetical protein